MASMDRSIWSIAYSEGLAIERVRLRVKQGGHHIPVNVIRRRFALGIRNFHEVYKHIVDSWDLIDNSGPIPIVVETGVKEA